MYRGCQDHIDDERRRSSCSNEGDSVVSSEQCLKTNERFIPLSTVIETSPTLPGIHGSTDFPSSPIVGGVGGGEGTFGWWQMLMKILSLAGKSSDVPREGTKILEGAER
jgi:hypothetical protein